MSKSTFAWFVSFFVGFLSLGQEVLWVRLASFANGNTPQTFGLVLGLFLSGIVLGSLYGKQVCSDGLSVCILKRGGLVLGLSGVIDVASPLLVAWVGVDMWRTPLMAALILLTSGFKAVLFPIVHHLGSRAQSVDTGRSVSRVYFMNIAGATISPIFIGFWALDYWTSQQLMQGFGIAAIALACLLFVGSERRVLARMLMPLLLLFFGFVGLMLFDPYSCLRAMAVSDGPDSVSFMRENRHGVIHTVRGGEQGDVVYGGNIYDGRINIDLLHEGNHIDRVYLLASLRPNPKRVLVIGLSGGAWTRVLAAMDDVERIDVVEINPAYLDLVAQDRLVQPILNDSRVYVHIDDGRRWLRRYDGPPFDLIVMNTTFHWRAYTTNLLSSEFMQILRSHLALDGVLAFNATGSPDALNTAADAFPYAFRWQKSNFVYASSRDFREFDQKKGEMALTLLAKKLTSAVDFGAVNFRLEDSVMQMLSRGWVSAEQDQALAGRPLELVTDKNMITEYRYGRGFR